MATLTSEFAKTSAPFGEVLTKEISDASRKPYTIPFFFGKQAMYNNWVNNTTSDPWTTANCRISNQASAEAMFWCALGGYSRGNGYSYSLQSEANGVVLYAKHDVIDYFDNRTEYNYSTYSSEVHRMSRVIFLRNFNPSSSQSMTWYHGGTTYWNQGSGGMGAGILTPNSSTYSGTTGMSFSNLWDYSNSTSNTNNSYTVTIPANTTIALIMGTSSYYYTNNYSWNWQWLHNYCYSLQSWSNNWIQPDMRLTLAASTFNGAGWASNTSQYQSHNIWQWAAQQYGDR